MTNREIRDELEFLYGRVRRDIENPANRRLMRRSVCRRFRPELTLLEAKLPPSSTSFGLAVPSAPVLLQTIWDQTKLAAQTLYENMVNTFPSVP